MPATYHMSGMPDLQRARDFLKNLEGELRTVVGFAGSKAAATTLVR